jgi:hypothetical protein
VIAFAKANSNKGSLIICSESRLDYYKQEISKAGLSNIQVCVFNVPEFKDYSLDDIEWWDEPVNETGGLL